MVGDVRSPGEIAPSTNVLYDQVELSSAFGQSRIRPCKVYIVSAKLSWPHF